MSIIPKSVSGAVSKAKDKAAQVAKSTKSSRSSKRSVSTPRSVTVSSSDDTILALDIGTEFVKAVIARPSKKGNSLHIIGVGKARQEQGNMNAGAIADIPAVVATCEQALAAAEQQAGITAKLVVVGIAGELVKGNTSTIRYRRKTSSRPITEQEMNLIIKRVQDRAGEKAKQEVATETDNPDVEVSLINSAIVSLQIDGYKVSNPVGFKGSDIAIQFYNSFAPLVHVSAIEKVCAELSLDLLAVAVEPFAVCRACLGDDLDSNFSAIVMDIGGGTTDIAVVDDGGVEGTKMFGIGGRSFTHQIATKLGTDFDTAEEYKLDPTSDKIPEQALPKIEEAIVANLSVWLSGVEIALEDFNHVDVLPNKILLCGGGAGLTRLQEDLATTDWYKELPFARRPVIHLLDDPDIPGIVNATDEDLDYSLITAFGLLRVALDTLAGESDEKGLRSKLAKILQN